MEIPQRFDGYRCGDYFASPAFSSGIWDEPAQLWFIVGADDVEERQELQFLVVGRPGCDGIEFGYHKGYDGLWAYYPIGSEFIVGRSEPHSFGRGLVRGNITV